MLFTRRIRQDAAGPNEGIGQWRIPDRTKVGRGGPTASATGSPLPLEDTAPPYAVPPERGPRFHQFPVAPLMLIIYNQLCLTPEHAATSPPFAANEPG
jgi:hypothetical protein